MSQPSVVVISRFNAALLRTASFFIPSPQREEWRREWSAELWHVEHSSASAGNTFSWQSQRQITSFCLGAFADALYLRSHYAKSHTAPAHVHGSAANTLLWLCAVMALCFVISRILPGVDAENQAAQYHLPSGVLMVSEAAAATQASISTALYLNWKAAPQRFFEELAFYRVSREAMDAGRGSTHWNVAHASENLLSLLGLPVDHPEAAYSAGPYRPTVILSHETWMRHFAGDKQIAGRIVRIGDNDYKIAGVAPAISWQLPGAPDAWLLESDTHFISGTSSETSGYLFARLSKRGQASVSGPALEITARNQDGFAIDLIGTFIADPVQGPWSIYRFGLFLALVALPAVTSVSLGDSHVSSPRPSLKQRMNRMLFLGAKFALIAAIGFAASLDIAYSHNVGYSPLAECLQLLCCFTICLLGFWWAVADQRKRCPVCLRRVSNPATVGLASRTFLGWNGTEMICMGGHALLHVPSLPTSWFSGQRWLYLDSSWDFLFGDSYVG